MRRAPRGAAPEGVGDEAGVEEGTAAIARPAGSGARTMAGSSITKGVVDACQVTREFNQRACEAWALRLAGEVASHGKGPDAATGEDSYGQALTLADELGMRPLANHCHFGLAKLHRRQARRAQAAEHLDTALSMFREMGMPYWLEQAEAEASQPALNRGAGRE